MKLLNLPFNVKAKIKSVDKKVISRLAAMGIIPGAEIKIIRASPLGDPLELEIKNYNLSLRKSECNLIEVERIKEEG
ncbi:MAG: FeoA family protein [Promethearchaeota archaeon]